MVDAVKETDEEDEFAEFETVGTVSTDGEGDKDEFADFEDVKATGSSTLSEKIGAVGQGATGSFAETAPIFAGMSMGASVGALVPPPFSAVTIPLGAAAGGLAGHMFGQQARETLSETDIPGTDKKFTFDKLKNLPPELRPFGVGGEVIGGSIPFASVPLALSSVGLRLPKSVVGNWINKVIDTAARSPGTFAAAEAAGAGGAASGAALAENLAPGETGPRLAGEAIGGFFNPTRIITSTANSGISLIKRTLQRMSAGARETEASKILQTILEASGDDPVAIARMLQDPQIAGTPNLTSAQITGSKALAALEAKLATENGAFSARAKQTTQDAFDFYALTIQKLRETGDPEALRAAAEMQRQHVKLLFSARIDNAKAQMVEAASKISRDDPAAVADIGRQAHNVLSEILTDSRAVEKELWGAVDRTVGAGADNLVASYNRLRGTMLPEEDMPPIIEKFIKRMNEEMAKAPGESALKADDILLFRSRALSLAREAQQAGKFNDARIYGDLAESALDDIDNAFKGVAGTKEAYDQARNFSRELNDSFTRSFSGRALRQGPGGDRIPPELLLEKALGTGKTAGSLRLRELEEATRFMDDLGFSGPRTEELKETMMDSQARLIRLAASESIDVVTGRISAKKLSTFMRNNGAMMKRFPEIEADLKLAVKSEGGLQKLEGMQRNVSSVVTKQSAFAKVANIERPSAAIKDAVRGRNPVKEMTALVKLAKRGGQPAKDGLKSSVYDFAIMESSKLSDGFNFERFRTVLFEPVKPGGPSLIQLMQGHGIIDGEGIKNVTKLLDQADKISKAAATTGEGAEAIIEQVDMFSDFVARVAGAKAAVAVSGNNAGSSILIASAGSRGLRNALDRVPRGMVKDVLIRAAEDPAFMAMLLQKQGKKLTSFQMDRQIHGYLANAGLTATTDEEEDR